MTGNGLEKAVGLGIILTGWLIFGLVALLIEKRTKNRKTKGKLSNKVYYNGEFYVVAETDGDAFECCYGDGENKSGPEFVQVAPWVDLLLMVAEDTGELVGEDYEGDVGFLAKTVAEWAIQEGPKHNGKAFVLCTPE